MTSSLSADLSDEEMRKLLKPSPAHEDVLNVLKKSYSRNRTGKGSVTIIKQLDSYDDCNYLVEMDDGIRYLAKIHNGVESQDFMKVFKKEENYYTCGTSSVIHLQNSIMDHLNEHGIVTSKPQPSNDAEATISTPLSPVSVHKLPVVSERHSPQELVVRLLSWMPGRTMASLTILPIECLADAGRFLGRMDQKLDLLDGDDFVASKRFHQWDGKNTDKLRQFIPCIKDEKRRLLIISIVDAFQHEILDTGVDKTFRQGIIQADFNDANILVNDDFQVSGVIDFGDSVMSWRVLEISVAMAYAVLTTYGKANRRISAACAMLRGFHSVYPVTDNERQHLHLLMACRLACSATLGAYSYQQNPENEYLLLHAEPAWETLELIWGYDLHHRNSMKKTLSQMIDLACKGKQGGVSTNDAGVIDCTDLSLPDPNVADLLAPLRSSGGDVLPSASPVKNQKTELNNVENGGKYVITFVTGNRKKLEEVKRILGSNNDGSAALPFDISNHKVDLPELQGDPWEIAEEKCAVAAKEVGGPVITEDTSLCFSALKNLPGPYIKWFLEKCGHDGLNDMIAFSQDKSAYAQTVVAFCPGPDKPVVVFDGRTMGKIVPPRGSLDFGWDPVFEPEEGGGLTYAEMSKEAKASISHRSRAFSQLREYFVKEHESIASSISQ